MKNHVDELQKKHEKFKKDLAAAQRRSEKKDRK